jgi:acetylornithine deacetylase/succinyl-diaminopimelate desuccinylase-like protein
VSAIADQSTQVSVRVLGSSRPTWLDRRHPAVQAAAAGYHEGFGVAPAYIRSGGSIGAAEAFQRILRIPSVLMGFGLPQAHRHAPNEQLHLPTWERCVTSSIRFMEELGRWRV